MTGTEIECGHTKTTLHDRGVNISLKIITFYSPLNPTKPALVVLILQFASFVFFRHLYA